MKRSFYILAFAASALFIGSCQKEGKGSTDTASDTDTIPVEQVLDTDTSANGMLTVCFQFKAWQLVVQ